MSICVDTNVLVRAAMQDDRRQGAVAAKLLRTADAIAIGSVTLCEFVWVLRRVYNRSNAEIALAVESLVAARNVVVERAAVDAGLSVLRDGGDFADGVIGYQGRWLGAEAFVSFDRAAVAAMRKQGLKAELLSQRHG